MFNQRRPTVCVFTLSTLILALTSVALAQNSASLKINDILPPNAAKNYDRLRPPKTDDNPAVVKLQITVTSIDSIDETSMSYSIALLLAQTWRDHRLMSLNMTKDYRIINVDWSEYLWMPELYFNNAKDSSMQTLPTTNHYLWYYKDKVLLYMLKAYVTLSCDMDFAAYPHDTQVCRLLMESLNYPLDDVVLVWDETMPLAVQKIVLPDLQLRNTSLTDCNKEYASAFSCLSVDFTFTRNVGYFFFHTYIPLYLVIFLSWLSFWAPPEAALARISLGATCLLAAAALLGRCHASAPQVTQLNAIEVFASICTLFAFLALMEYFLVMVFLGDSYLKSSSHGSLEIASKIDIIARIAFPAFYVLFNIIYWIVVATL